MTEILEPQYVSSVTEIKWHQQADVLVVGWGAAGAATALESLEQGASVIVIDRFNGGGASAKSGGVVYAGGGTSHQVKAGFADTSEAMFDYLKHETLGVVSDDTLKKFCDDSKGNLEWLESHGAPYTHTMPPGGKTSYPADGYYLYYSGNETVPSHMGDHPPAPRGHRTVGKGHGGVVLYAKLKEACLKKGVIPLTQTRVSRLILLKDTQQVIGVEAWRMPPGHPQTLRHQKLATKAEAIQNTRPKTADQLRREIADLENKFSEKIFIRGSSGVVLSTGGFIFNKEMLEKYAPKYTKNFKIGATGCDGSAVRLGLGVNAAIDRMSTISAWRFINPPATWPKGIVVNKTGKRIFNEEVYGATLGYHICENNEGKAWLLLDSKLRWDSLKNIIFGKMWWFQWAPALMLMYLGVVKAKTPEELAHRLKMDPNELTQSFTQYNQAIQNGQKDPLGKSAAYTQALVKPPYYALNIGTRNKFFPLGSLTLGGLKVNELTGRVKRDDGTEILGLYAAGRAAVGVPSNLYISGLSLADCIFSGRRCARAILGKGQ
jgi:3-oxo-5alpha-steroid 4-dehydrogenase